MLNCNIELTYYYFYQIILLYHVVILTRLIVVKNKQKCHDILCKRHLMCPDTRKLVWAVFILFAIPSIILKLSVTLAQIMVFAVGILLNSTIQRFITIKL